MGCVLAGPVIMADWVVVGVAVECMAMGGAATANGGGGPVGGPVCIADEEGGPMGGPEGGGPVGGTKEGGPVDGPEGGGPVGGPVCIPDEGGGPLDCPLPC